MRCESAQLALSAKMDGEASQAESAAAAAHAAGCATCARFARGAWRLRELARFEVAPEVPDLVPAIMAGARRERRDGRGRIVPFRPQGAGQARVVPIRGRDSASRASGTRRAAALGLVAGLVAGLVISAGVLPRRDASDLALAAEIPLELRRAAASLRAYRATFDISESNWTKAVPRRSFRADVAFRAPERLRIGVEDRSPYPSPAWPRNDLSLVSDGRSWRAEGPDPCPAPALPACPAGAVVRTVRDRAPFEASTPLPTDIIVPMTVLAASDRVNVVGTGDVAGHSAVVVQLAYQDARSLFDYLRFLGSWRPFFPQDHVRLWLDRKTWFPLRYQVFPARGSERAMWATQSNLPHESPEVSVFEATISSLSTWSARSEPEASATVPPVDLFEVSDPATGATDMGFDDVSLAELAASGQAPPRPAWTGDLRVVRSGRFVRSPARPYEQSVVAYASGLSWLTVTGVSGWDRSTLFGVGRFAERVDLSPAGASVGYFEPAGPEGPRRLAIHASHQELLVSSNLDRRTLLRVASSLPLVGLPEPDAWRLHRWRGGLVRELTPDDAVARAGFPMLLPSALPAGYAAVAAELSVGSATRGVTIAYRRQAAELDGVGLLLHQAQGQSIAPPSEAGAIAVQVGAAPGRWSPEAHRLEWMDGDIYRSLSGPAFDLEALLGVAESLGPAAREGAG